MPPITLTKKTSSGILSAIFLPEKGLNLQSFKLDEVEIIDQTTRNLFEERCAGLGALIGPHFHHRNPNVIPKIADETLFPHIARVHSKGILEPFSHGIARYAPWNATHTEEALSATLTGKDLWNGVPLADLEGQNFTMRFKAKLNETGMQIQFSIVSDTDSVVGLHYYYRLPKNKGLVKSRVAPFFVADGQKHSIESHWPLQKEQWLSISVEDHLDHRFFPYPNPLYGEITLETEEYSLTTQYTSPSQENSWQLYHPKDSSFVCIEPLSATDPRHPNLTVSSLDIQLSIEKGKK